MTFWIVILLNQTDICPQRVWNLQEKFGMLLLAQRLLTFSRNIYLLLYLASCLSPHRAQQQFVRNFFDLRYNHKNNRDNKYSGNKKMATKITIFIPPIRLETKTQFCSMLTTRNNRRDSWSVTLEFTESFSATWAFTEYSLADALGSLSFITTDLKPLWVLACLGYGKRYLNNENAFFKYANKAVYPFYILHQTVIVAIGYYVVRTSDNAAFKYIFIFPNIVKIFVAL